MYEKIRQHRQERLHYPAIYHNIPMKPLFIRLDLFGGNNMRVAGLVGRFCVVVVGGIDEAFGGDSSEQLYQIADGIKSRGVA